MFGIMPCDCSSEMSALEQGMQLVCPGRCILLIVVHTTQCCKLEAGLHLLPSGCPPGADHPQLSPHLPPCTPPAAVSPPTVADAKAKFTAAFKKPLPAIYSTIVQELLVQQHLFRWNRQYKYSEVGAARPPAVKQPAASQGWWTGASLAVIRWDEDRKLAL